MTIEPSVQRQAIQLVKTWMQKQKVLPLASHNHIADMVARALNAGVEPRILIKALDNMTAWTPEALDYCVRSLTVPQQRRPSEYRAELPARPTTEQVERFRVLMRSLRADLRGSSEEQIGGLPRWKDRQRSQAEHPTTPIPPPPDSPPLRLLRPAQES